MAFQPNNLVRWAPLFPSQANSLTQQPLQITPPPALPQQWAYQAGSDSKATVEANGYFYYFAGYEFGPLYNNGNFLQVGDTIYCVCSDGNVNLQVTQVSPTINTAEQVVPAGDIPLTSGHVLVGNASNKAADVAMSGDATMANTGALTIANSAITNAKVSASAAIDFSKLAALPSADILVGSAGNVATAVAMSGDATISNTGALTIGAGKVTSSKLDATTIQYIKVPMTLAEWNAMYGTPFQIIAAPASGSVINILGFYVSMTYGSAALTGGGAVSLQFGNAAHAAGVLATATIPAASFTGLSANGQVGANGIMGVGSNSATAVYISNDTAAFATGTGASFNIVVSYMIGTL